ncbi:hypothetical protein JCM10212_002372 [Sporobolomyces blumeae]
MNGQTKRGGLNPHAPEFTLPGMSAGRGGGGGRGPSQDEAARSTTTGSAGRAAVLEPSHAQEEQEIVRSVIAPTAVTVVAAAPRSTPPDDSHPSLINGHDDARLSNTHPQRDLSPSSQKSSDTATPQPRTSSSPPRPEPSSAPVVADDLPPLQLRYRSSTHELDPDASSLSTLSSLSSVYSLLPLRTFRRLHLLQFASTFLLLFVVPVVFLVVYKREFRWWPFALGISSWLAGETLRDVVFELLTTERVEPDELGGFGARGTGKRRKRVVVPTIVHSVAQEFLRLGAIYLVVALLPPVDAPSPAARSLPFLASIDQPRPPRAPLPPLDTLFWSAIFLSLGWAFVEILWGSRQFWKQLDCYSDVLGRGDADDDEATMMLDDEERIQVLEGTRLLERTSNLDYGGTNESGVTTTTQRVEEEEAEDEEEFAARLRQIQRDEIEDQLGVPLYEIPVAVVFIWRLDSILLSLVFTLFLSLPFRTTSPSLIAFPLWPTFACVACVHALLSALWVTKVRTTGIPSVSYASLVILVGGMFAALGSWGVLA